MGTYHPVLIGRWFFFALFGVFGIATVALLAVSTTDGGPPVAFVLFWIFALGWNAYWWLFRVACSLDLRGEMLEWEAPARRGVIPITDLTAFRPMTLVPNVVVIKHAGGRPLLVMPGKGISGLAAELRDARPDLDVRVGIVGAMGERMPGPSAWRKND